MKAIVVTDRTAGTAGMTLMERPLPAASVPNYGDVIVQVHASGFTGDELSWPSTWIDRLGRDRTPSIPGHEVAGVAMRLAPAIEQARTLSFDLAVLDVNLDGHLSFPIADVLRTRGIPFLFATGYGAAGIAAGYQNARVIKKPFLQADLAAAIADVIA